MRARLAAAILVSTLSGTASADSVLAGGREWAGAKIQWFQDGKVRFSAVDGSQQAVPIVTVTRLQVDLRDDLNRAEQLRVDGKAAEALPAYEAALRTENRNDLGGFIRYRLMGLYGQAGQLDRAVEMFLDLVKQPDFHAVVKDWRPSNMTAVKPKVREAAAAALEGGLRQIRTGLASESVRELRDFIQAAKLPPPGQAAGTSPTAKASASTPSPTQETSRETDGAAEAFVPEPLEEGPPAKALRAGQYAEALHLANAALTQPDLSHEQLAEALYVRGFAQWQLARDSRQYLQAGWALSRLLVEFPSDRRVPECLYCLGLVHQKLGQAGQARQLLQQAMQSATSPELRERVRKALQETDNKS
jgi:tetratricopeptide (TPR) repeat protein